jgi:hypothetical protein
MESVVGEGSMAWKVPCMEVSWHERCSEWKCGGVEGAIEGGVVAWKVPCHGWRCRGVESAIGGGVMAWKVP